MAAAETRNRLVYTAEARTGNFRYLNGLPVSPANVAANPSALRSVNLLTLKPTRNTIDPTMAAQLARTQLPNNYDIGDGLNTGGFRFNAFRGAPRDIYSFRADHHFNDKYSLEFNHSYGNDFQIGDLTDNRLQQFPDEVGVDRKLRGRSISTALVAAFNPKLVNEFRFGFQNSELAFTNTYFGCLWCGHTGFAWQVDGLYLSHLPALCVRYPWHDCPSCALQPLAVFALHKRGDIDRAGHVVIRSSFAADDHQARKCRLCQARRRLSDSHRILFQPRRHVDLSHNGGDFHRASYQSSTHAGASRSPFLQCCC